MAKYTNTMSTMFTQVYNWLPLCHCINKRVLVMHGGLFANDNVTLDDLRQIERNRQPPEEGLMCDLLWSDPQFSNGRGFSKRGVGIQFGPDVTEQFCRENELDYIVRSHEVKAMGYEVAHNGKCITVFSAPNYWWAFGFSQFEDDKHILEIIFLGNLPNSDTMDNLGAFIVLGSDLKPNFTTYEAVVSTLLLI